MHSFYATRVTSWWNHIILPLSFWIYLIGFKDGISYPAIQFCLMLLVASGCLASLGYVINDFFDRASDRIAGKPNFFDQTPVRSLSITSLALGLGTTAWLLLPLKPMTVGLLLSEFVLLVIYSAPPFRLKNRAVGVLVDALYSRVVPILTVLSLGDLLPIPSLIVLSIWMLVAGTRNILLHQIGDVNNDALANEQTAVLKMGAHRTMRLILHFLLPLEFLFAIIALVILSNQISYMYLTLLFFLVLTVVRFKIWQTEHQSLVIWKERALFLPNNFYEDVLPIGLLILLSITKPSFWPFVVAHVLIFPHSRKKIFHDFMSIAAEMFYYFLANTKTTIEFLYCDVRPQLKKGFSIVVNKPIIWGFIFAGVDLEKENLSAIEYFKKRLNRGR